MKITLVLCPSWGIETPHLGIALLSANLRKNGFAVEVLDLNIRFHNRHKEEGLWKSEEDVHWEDPQSLNRFVQENFNGFGLFEKLDARTEGTGLGLALIKRIVEVHGGTIRVESEGAGQGSCFLFTLPKAIQAPGEAR